MGVRYIWYKNLYFGEKAAKEKEKLVRQLEKGRYGGDIFLLTLPESADRNILDIYRALELKQKFYDGRRKYVVGIARGREEAFELVTELMDGMHKDGDNFNIRSFLDFYEQEV